MRTWVWVLMLAVFSSQAEQVKMGEPLVVAQTMTMTSKVLGEQREVYISLPADYHQHAHTYPVLILLDAQQSMFHAVSSARMLSEWRGLPDLIVVGLPSVNRLRDFTHDKVEAQSDDSGGAHQFTKFVTQELMPYVDKHYRTHPFTLVAGHSLGGLYVANEMLSEAQPYDAHIVIAPALWWNEFAAIKSAQQWDAKEGQANLTAFFGIGELDGWGMKNELSQFIDNLSNNPSVDLRYQHQVYAGEGHMSAPLRTLYDGLVHVFGDITYQRTQWAGFTADGFEQREQAMLDKYGPTATQTAETYVYLADHLLQQSNYNGALAVQKANAKAYPNYPPNHEAMANTYLLLGDKSNARKQFLKAREYAMANTSSGSGEAERYLAEVGLIDNPITHSPDALDAFEGCFKAGENTAFDIQQADGQLRVRINNGEPVVLFGIDPHTFKLRTPPHFTFAFSPGEAGKQPALNVNAYGADYDAKAVECNTISAGGK